MSPENIHEPYLRLSNNLARLFSHDVLYIHREKLFEFHVQSPAQKKGPMTG